jgi:DNA-binding CsgD family transcriptional regulator
VTDRRNSGDPRARLERRAVDLAYRACEVLGGAGDDAQMMIQPPWPDALAMLGRRCLECLRERGPRLSSTTAAQLAMLVSELEHLALDFDEQRTASHMARIRSCETTLTRLRGRHGSADLLAGVCRSVALGCRFSRVVLSRVEDDQWWPSIAYFENAADLEPWGEAWLDRPVALDGGVLETGLVTGRSAVLVKETSVDRVHDLIRAGRSTSYVAAPIVLDGRVAGFLHADHDGRLRCDELDREILGAFAAGFAPIYERTVLLECMRARCAEIRETLADVESTLALLSDAEPAIGSEAAGCGTEALSARERDVIELMVAGATNEMIADELLITVGTVKAHVKRILRKLGAVNRSNAVARYLGMLSPSPTGTS